MSIAIEQSRNHYQGFVDLAREKSSDKTNGSYRIEDIEQAEAEFVANPSERINSQLNELAVLYSDRTIYDKYEYSGNVHDFAVFATRTYDESDLEEIYTIYDKYSPGNKLYHERTYLVTVLGKERPGYQIIVHPDTTLEVREQGVGGERVVNDDKRKKELIDDFFHRSLNATVRSLARDDLQAATAHHDALTKLYNHSFAKLQMPEVEKSKAKLMSRALDLIESRERLEVIAA